MNRKIKYNNKLKNQKKITIKFNNYYLKIQCQRIKYMKKHRIFNKFNKK